MQPFARERGAKVVERGLATFRVWALAGLGLRSASLREWFEENDFPRPWREIGRGSQRRNRGAGRQELRVHRERSRRDLRAICGPSTSSFCPCRAWKIG
jgi:hypothetical protein